MKSVGFSWGVRQNIQQTNPFSLRSSSIDTNQPTAATTLYWKPPQWFDLVGRGQMERQRQSTKAIWERAMEKVASLSVICERELRSQSGKSWYQDQPKHWIFLKKNQWQAGTGWHLGHISWSVIFTFLFIIEIGM